VFIDMTNVESMSEGFADEAFAIIVVAHGAKWFKQRIQLEGVKPLYGIQSLQQFSSAGREWKRHCCRAVLGTLGKWRSSKPRDFARCTFGRTMRFIWCERSNTQCVRKSFLRLSSSACSLEEASGGRMRRINVAEDIVPDGECSLYAAELLEQLHQTRLPIVITQDGKPAALMITPDDFEDISFEEEEDISYAEEVRAKILEGIESAAREPTVSPEDAKRILFAVIARVAEQSRVAGQ
jgi:PHD/YefM family antitoxin component YafN of YafNO toxin-antitoxin module